MRAVFFGTGRFGIPVLKSILSSGHELVAVVTRPDNRKGRGWKVSPAPIKEIIEKVAPAMPVLQPEDPSSKETVTELKSMGADIFIVVDYGKILRTEILDIPEKYCINLHPSLLPLFRGPAPINRAILNGESETGNTVIKMNERMDAGDIIASEKIAIKEHDTAEDIFRILSEKGGSLMLKVLDNISSGIENFIPQEESKATYAAKLVRSEGEINWKCSAREIILKVRGTVPWPGAYTRLDGKILKILEAAGNEALPGAYASGEVIRADTKLLVNSGSGAVRIAKLQLEGKKAMTSDEFLRGHEGLKGKILG